MRLNELFQVLIGLFLFASLECGRTDHVHLKIHVPDIVHKHKHVKTKYVHVYHPKVIHTDSSSPLTYLHARNDPNVGSKKLVNGGYPQPLLNINRPKDLSITEDDFFKWRQEQQRKAFEKRRQLQQQNHPDDEDNNNEYDENAEDDEQDESYEEDLYKKHKANKANSSLQNKKKHRNHNYNHDHDSSNSDKIYTNHPVNKASKKNSRPSQRNQQDGAKKFKVYGASNADAEATNIHHQYTNIDPTAIDPGYYSTLPKNAALSSQDDIYSGLISKKYNKDIADKTKLLADINYSRKQQTKTLIQKRKGQ